MTQIKSISRFAAALVMVLLIATPSFAARGKADFRTFVTMGDSLTFGISNLAGVVTHQQFSWPAIFARQVGLRTDCNASNDAPNCFQQALISEPGVLPELVLTSLSPLGIGLKPGLGSAINSTLARPYNNLAIDGAEIADAISVDGDGNEAFSGPIVLRGQGSVIDQALRLNPTFIGIWFGADDFFGTLEAGTPAGLTPTADFTRDYATVLDRLIAGAPNAGMVVGNLPSDIRGLPFVSAVPTILIDPASGKPVLGPDGKTIALVADLGGGNFGQLPAGSAILFTAAGLLRSGYGIPAAFKPLLPNLPDVGKPLPASAVLTPDEIAAFNTRIAEYNATITTLAAARNIPVADIGGLFMRAATTGVQVGPFNFNLKYLTGGVISIDSAHPTDLGYVLVANEFIKTVNRAYGTHIPLASITQVFQNNDPSSLAQSIVGLNIELDAVPAISPEALDVLNGKLPEPWQ